MNNIYNDPAYAEIQQIMHKRYVEMRKKYGDSDELDKQFIDRYVNR